jgi:predicted DNA-binding transcriptional regulator AlpA
MSELQNLPWSPIPFKNSVTAKLVLDGFVRRAELAKMLGLSARTLDRWHSLRAGPPRVCVGRTILYNVESVRAWLRSHEQQPGVSTSRNRNVRRQGEGL